MRRHRRFNSKTNSAKQKKMIILSSLALFLVFSIGYAAFQTAITLNVKGNVKKEFIRIGGQKVNLVATGDGLYDNGNETYTYKGSNPANYLSFQGSTWRILGIDSTGIKIIRDEKLDTTMAFDTANARTTANNSYCTDPSFGCNVWSKDYLPAGNYTNGTTTGTVTEDSTLKTYLNGDYYTNTLSSNSNIIDGTYNVGPLDNETAYTWTGKVALLTGPEYKAAALDSSGDNYNTNNYLKKSSNWWLMSPYASSTGDVYCVNSSGSIRYISAYYGIPGVRPVLYLSSNITLTGSGTSDAHYELTGGGSGGGITPPAPTRTIDQTFVPQYYEHHTGDFVTVGQPADTTNWVQDSTELTGRTYFLGHDVEGGNVTANYVCFVINDTQYCMKASTDGSPWQRNKNLLGTLRDTDKITCSYFVDSYATCSGDGLGYLGASSSGQAGVGVSTNVLCNARADGNSRCAE